MSGNALGKRDALLIAQLAAGNSHEKVAAACGCCTATVQRRLRDPKFRAALDDARRQLFENAFSRVTAAGQAAAATLISLLSRETPPAVRLGASRTLLESSCKFRETHELEERLKVLEERMATQKKSW
jgi:hypothetical protein